MTPRVALTIAGSDSGGGAGLQADLNTFAAHRVHGTSAVTAVTAQNTVTVRGVVPVDPPFVVAQIEAVLSDITVDAVKTGMLAGPDTVAAVAELAAAGVLPLLVVDPVLVSSTGRALMEAGGVAAYRELLIPHAAVVTPNLWETALLVGTTLEDLATVDAMCEAAAELRVLGARTAVVKGGHLPVGISPDVVATKGGVAVLPALRVDTSNDHGTGCSLSAAIAALLARGADSTTAVEHAKDYVRRGLTGASGWRIGAGHGPIDHFGWSTDGEPRVP